MEKSQLDILSQVSIIDKKSLKKMRANIEDLASDLNVESIKLDQY